MRIYFTVFVIAFVAVAIWGWSVQKGVRVTATRTDNELRTLGWAVLAYADANGGAFPMDLAALKSVGAARESISLAPPSDGGGWPTRRSDALQGHEPSDLDASARSILIAWGTDPGMPPYFKPDGLPTHVGTGLEVNGWLAALGKRGGAPVSQGAAQPDAPSASQSPPKQP